MLITVGQIERKTQGRVVALFQHTLGYEYLGDWADRAGNANIEQELLRAWLTKQGVDASLITRALFELTKVAADASKSLYDRNKAVYELLRYGVRVKPEVGENTQTVWLIDWKNAENNHFALAEEVTVKGADAKASTKRPDIVLYINGIALAVLELKRSRTAVNQGIRQSLDNQKPEFIQPFFSTMQLVMAGNDTQGMRYGTIQTGEKYFLTWKEDSPVENLLDRHLQQVCSKRRLLELVHDYVAYDSGVKKLCRQNQYFGVRAAQDYLRRREGGIIWHTQGSGKSLTMVWLAKWIRENIQDSRVLIITDRTELDEQIEKVFTGVNEQIYRSQSGADLIAKLNQPAPWLLCSLVHKFGSREEDESANPDIKVFLEELRKNLPADFRAKGDIYVFVDECHRTQSGELHKAMKAILPNALFVGFTGTPLLKADKQKSIEVFGGYIHTYKFDEAVKDGVVLDLRYEARDIDQNITSQKKIDQWFEAKTKGLNGLAKAQLKQRWGSMQKVLSSQSRLEKIVADIMLDLATRDRLANGRGNAMLVTSSIFEACKCYELFAKAGMADTCAIVTSYKPSPADIKGEATGEGLTEKLRKYNIYNQMLNGKDPEVFEKEVKQKFIKEPGQMKLLIVVDKLLTGFDAPSATYLYIDKQMRDHGLFQAICRVNRLDGEDKQYGYIVDYKDLFKQLENSIDDYTSNALDGFDKADVAGLLEDRLSNARDDLEDAREAIKALCEPVDRPRDTPAYLRYFCGSESGNAEQLKANEPRRLNLYKMTSALIRCFASVANELKEAGYSAKQIGEIKDEVDHYNKVRDEVKVASGDYIDLKAYEPDMRFLIDTYIRAEESEKISAFDDMSLIQLIVERGVEAVEALPKGIRGSQEAVAETIENNVRKLIIDESPINPKYYETMSSLLDALIAKRKEDAISYQEYLQEVVELAKQAKNPSSTNSYPSTMNTGARQALYDNLDRNAGLALAVDNAVLANRQDDWRNNAFKVRKVRLALKDVLDAAGHDAAELAGEYHSGSSQKALDKLLELITSQRDY
ncbi:HsdR family type I site-specific deoxyribonuclease [Pseudomonas sp. p99-361]|uniref:type I restriction endonuclease subunit R n=1 Tax=Pseudomonas sp. p99-361 TaxID=2479852 RepID=UPI000F7887E0|nr:HsdR family type I site-specific deoxyribonuclease [Pseudomonas sp. p99-361]MCT8187287.1 HsdR family type I site-specific deoxyribonuclease [Pseudomonas monteilii]RRV10047.1 HsdR family type I site-specific deoxyribonuclease [Pseudomonas sp. p99-361]